MNRPGLRPGLRGVALLLILAGLVVPRFMVRRPVHDVLVVLDITASMNTADMVLDGRPIARLAVEKLALRRLLDRMPCGSRLAVAVFVERVPFLLFDPLEICGNYEPLRREISALDWRMGWDSESHIAEALLRSMQMAQHLGTDLVFMTDGQESPPLWWNGLPKFAPLRGSVPGAILGLGGNRLVPIPRFDSQNHQIGYYRSIDVPSDAKGMFAGHGNLTAEDTPHLRQLAALTGLSYRHLGTPDGLWRSVQATGHARRLVTRIDAAPYAAALALGIFVLSFAPLSRPARGRGRDRS